MMLIAGLALFAFIIAITGMFLYLLVAIMWGSYTDYKLDRREYHEELYQDCLLRLQDMEETRDRLREAEAEFMVDKVKASFKQVTQ